MQIVQLRDCHYLAEGERRRVYRHPEIRNLCIKIRHAWIKDFAQARREIAYWRLWKYLRADMRRLAVFAGHVETSLGVGTAWELVRNHDHTEAETLREIIERGTVNRSQIWCELHRFKDWMLTNRVLPTDLHARNLVCRFCNSKDFELVLVDGWGNNEFLPVSTLSGRLGRRKIERKWRKLHDEVVSLIGQPTEGRPQSESTASSK